MTDYRAIAMQWVTEPHRTDVEAIARHLHANESLHLHDCIEGTDPCSYCWLRAAKAIQAIERTDRQIIGGDPAAEVKRLQNRTKQAEAETQRLQAGITDAIHDLHTGSTSEAEATLARLIGEDA